VKRVELPHGIRVTTFEKPPIGFNPMNARPNDLLRYGFPPIPTDTSLLEKYEKVVRRLAGKFEYVEPEFEVRSDRSHGGPINGQVWAGGVVSAPAGDSCKWVLGSWIIPNVSAPTDQRGYYSAHWVGIDGTFGSGDVCQAGVDCDAERYTGSLKRNIKAWFEWAPAYSVYITSLTVMAGDYLNVQICTDAGAGSTQASLYFTNITSGQYTSFIFYAPAGTQLVGNCAEWISEAPTIHGTQDPNFLADFGEVFFSECWAGTVQGKTLTSGQGDFLDLVSPTEGLLCHADLLGADIVRNSYVGPAPSGKEEKAPKGTS
jgi:hypothetical protein